MKTALLSPLAEALIAEALIAEAYVTGASHVRLFGTMSERTIKGRGAPSGIASLPIPVFAPDEEQHWRIRSVVLMWKRRRNASLAMEYRKRLRQTNHCLDQTMVNFELEFTVLRDERDELQQDLETARRALRNSSEALRQVNSRIRDLELNGVEKDKGMDLIRQALAEAGITQGSLVERIHALAADRDQWKTRVQQSAATV